MGCLENRVKHSLTPNTAKLKQRSQLVLGQGDRVRYSLGCEHTTPKFGHLIRYRVPVCRSSQLVRNGAKRQSSQLVRNGTKRVKTPPFLYRVAGKSTRPLSVDRPLEIFGLASSRVFRQVTSTFLLCKISLYGRGE